MAGGAHRRPGYPGTGYPSEAPGPADGKRRLIRGEGLVARISNDYRPQLPAVGKDIQGAQLGVLFAVPDSEESDNDVWHAEEHDTTVQQVSRREGWLTQTANNSCGEGCAQLDDFKWFCRPRSGPVT